jgi:hypothetical protein
MEAEDVPLPVLFGTHCRVSSSVGVSSGESKEAIDSRKIAAPPAAATAAITTGILNNFNYLMTTCNNAAPAGHRALKIV